MEKQKGEKDKAKMGFPKLTIITVVRNNLAGLESTFASLLPLLKGDLLWEHLLIDASPEAHEPWLVQHD